MPNRRFAGTITVPTTAASLYSLMAAIDAQVSRKFSAIKIVGDDLNTQPVYVGKADVSTTQFTDKLINGGDIIVKERGWNSVSSTEIYLVTPSGTQKVHVEAEVF